MFNMAVEQIPSNGHIYIEGVIHVRNSIELGADHLIPGGGGGYGFFVKKKIVQQIFENK